MQNNLDVNNRLGIATPDRIKRQMDINKNIVDKISIGEEHKEIEKIKEQKKLILSTVPESEIDRSIINNTKNRNIYFTDLGLPRDNCAIRLPSDRVFIPERLNNNIEKYLDRSLNPVVRRENQKTLEDYLIREQGVYSKLNPELTMNFINNNYKFDINNIIDMFNNYGNLDSSLHDLLACYIASITFTGRLDETLAPRQRERVKDWITNLFLKNDLSSGLILIPEVEGETNNLFLVKTQTNNKIDELYHEILVGYFALNKLKKFIPNFVYTYGYFNCSRGFLTTRGFFNMRNEIEGWCSANDTNSYYVIYENIVDSIPLTEWILDREVTTGRFLSVFYQIINALNLAYMKYGYTHYDLHPSNILIKKYDSEIITPFYGSNGVVNKYISTRYVPYITNYSKSHIRLFDQRDEPIHFTNTNNFHNGSFPLFDIYKLVLHLGTIIINKNNDVYNVLSEIFSFFALIVGDREISLTNAIEIGRNNGPIFDSLDISYTKNSINTLINLLEESSLDYSFVYDLDLITNKRNIERRIDKCNVSQLFSSVPLVNFSSLEYCETYSSIESNNELTKDMKNEMIDELNSSFNIPEIFQHEKRVIESLFNKMLSYNESNITPPIIEDDTIIDISLINRYRNIIFDILSLRSYVSDIFSLLKSNECSLRYRDKAFYNNNSNYFNENIERVNKYVVLLNNVKNIMMNNNKFILTSINRGVCTANMKDCNEFVIEHSNIMRIYDL